MSTGLSSAIDILHSAEIARLEGMKRGLGLLSPCPSSTIERILLPESEIKLGKPDFQALIKDVSQSVKDHKIKRNITDWPFENFWMNPTEPRHSKLLHYFINPDADHPWARPMLEKLFLVLKENGLNSDFTSENCEVFVETGEFSEGRIDLLIKSDSEDNRFAIIIENKVNYAGDTERQLRKYIEGIHINCGYEYNKIYVFYLPLENSKEPDREDRDFIKQNDVYFRLITFREEITQWLKEVLNDWPDYLNDGPCEGIKEHVIYYKKLINYLINNQQQQIMNAEILGQLQLAEQNLKPLPTLADIENLKKSVEELQECLKTVLRAKLLIAVHSEFKDAWYCDQNAPIVRIHIDSPYDHRFINDVNVCIPVNGAISACVGGNTTDFWIGLMKHGLNNEKIFQEAAETVAETYLGHIDVNGSDNDRWYALCWRNHIYSNCSVENLTAQFVTNLRELRDRLKGMLSNSTTVLEITAA